ncbi:MAG TPA: hypothetical protein VH372_16615 [Actinospica sp.]|jgi:hypothetical protein|nr:hypothetical protein [Actinospica sp.]
MSETERRRSGVEEYERTRREIAEHQVVDVAEDILGHAWIARLDSLRADTANAVAAAVENRQAAQRLMHAARFDTEPRRRSARALLERSERDLVQVLAESRDVFATVDGHLALLGRATLARLRRGREDRSRLNAARIAAFGPTVDSAEDADSADRGGRRNRGPGR